MNKELFAELVVKIKAGNNCRMQFTSIETPSMPFRMFSLNSFLPLQKPFVV